MPSTTALSEAEMIVANQETILQNQALLLKHLEQLKKNQETLRVIVRNQEKILAALQGGHAREDMTEKNALITYGIGGFTRKGG